MERLEGHQLISPPPPVPEFPPPPRLDQSLIRTLISARQENIKELLSAEYSQTEQILRIAGTFCQAQLYCR
jgi:hypothetical protein